MIHHLHLFPNWHPIYFITVQHHLNLSQVYIRLRLRIAALIVSVHVTDQS